MPVVEKAVDVVGLYRNPPERAVVLCVDQKSGIQARDELDSAGPSSSGCLYGFAPVPALIHEHERAGASI